MNIKYLLLSLLIFLLTSCAQLEQSIGIDETDNAIQCVIADAHTSYGVSNANISTTRIEFPGWLKTADLSRANIADVTIIFETIAKIADAIQCP